MIVNPAFSPFIFLSYHDFCVLTRTQKRLISEIIIKKEIKVYIKALDPGTVPGFIIISKKE